MSQIRDSVTTFIAVPSKDCFGDAVGEFCICVLTTALIIDEYFIDVIETHGYGMRFKLTIVSIHVV